ncbi:MAG: efflux RND transporter periplasmic adaptor subunit [Chitinophagaceae bacterium]
MEVLHINSSGEQSDYLVKSPLSGFVVEKHITENMRLRPDNNENIFTVADLTTVWAIANIFESDIATVREGTTAYITTLAYPGKTFTGKIDKVANMLDKDNKALQARIIIDNPGYLLKPGMFTNIIIKDSSLNVLPLISSNAVIFDNNKNYVLLVTNDKKAIIREVEIEKTVNGKTYIKKGLDPGDRVITSRLLFLYEALKN